MRLLLVEDDRTTLLKTDRLLAELGYNVTACPDGKTALVNSHPDEYEKVVARTYNEKIDYVEAENDFFGFDHAELGACVAKKWGLPASLVEVIRHHHAPGALASLDEATARLTALTNISTSVLTRLGVGRSQPNEDLELSELPAWHYLELTEHDVEPVLELCTERVKNSQSMVS